MLLIFGTAAFVIDVLNPETPNPSVWVRAFINAYLLSVAIRTLFVLRVPSIEQSTKRVEFAREVTLEHHACDVLDLTCSRLR